MFKRGMWLAVLAFCFIIGSAQAKYDLQPKSNNFYVTCGDTVLETKTLCVDSLQCAKCCTCAGCGPNLEVKCQYSNWIKSITPNPGHVECFSANNCIQFQVVFQVPPDTTECRTYSFKLYARGMIPTFAGDACSSAYVDSQDVSFTLEDNDPPTVTCDIDWDNSAELLETKNGHGAGPVDTFVVRGGHASSFPFARCYGGDAEAMMTYSCSTTDNCSSTCVCNTPAPNAPYFKKGDNGTANNWVKCTATDMCNNAVSCSFYVWVETIEKPCNKIDDDCDGPADEDDPSCYELVYVDDDWAGHADGDSLMIGFDGEEVRYNCNGFSTLRKPIDDAKICGSQMWVYPGVYDIVPAPLAIGVNNLEMYSVQGPEVTIISCGCNALEIHSDNVTIGANGRGFTFADNINAITVMGGASGTQIHHNHFCGNTESAVRNFNSDVDAELNWWGHCTGPYHELLNPHGLGDAVLGSDVDFDPWLDPCLVTYDDVVCMDHVNSEDPDNYPEEFLLGSPGDFARKDLYAVAFYNPGGEANLKSLAFQFYDPGQIKAWVYLAAEDSCPPCGSLEPEFPPIDVIYDAPADVHTDSLAHIPIPDPLFIGTWGWETVEEIEDPCIQIPAKRCFFIVWQQDSELAGIPRILGDAGHSTTFSWIYNAKNRVWKCFPGYEFMVKVCLDYTPDCLEIHEPDITWSHPEHGKYPCYDDPFTVSATFSSNCEEDAGLQVEFMEAPWGLFRMPFGYPDPYDMELKPYCQESITVPGEGTATVDCDCEFFHFDYGNRWARNIILRWTRDIMGCVPSFRHETGEMEECLNTPDTWYYSRRCRMTIWPDSTWSKKPVRWGLSPIEIPVFNPEGREMRYELSVLDVPEGWSWDLSWDDEILEPQELRSVYLTVRPGGEEPTEPVVIRVQAFKCNGEYGEVEIEFMPYTPKLNLQEVEITGLWWSPRYPCHDVPYDVWTEVHNKGTESAYPKISFGLAQWGFFFPALKGSRFDTTLSKDLGLGIGGGDYKIIAPYHRDTPFFVYKDEECTYYQGYYRNLVIDYPYVERHCYDVEVLTERYYRDCEAWLWPKHRWPWDPVAIPIPVYNEHSYPDVIFLGVEVPGGWDYSLDRDVFELNAFYADTAWLSLIPPASGPTPVDFPVYVDVMATRSFCKLDTAYAHIKFMPFTGMCIPDYNGEIVEDPPGPTPPQYGPGDDVQVSLMLENDYPVSAAQIDVHFEAAYLEVIKVEPTTRTEGMQLGWYLMPGEDGHLMILIDSTPVPHVTILPSDTNSHCEDGEPGSLSIASVWFEVKAGAPVGHCTDIVYGTVVLDGLPTWPDPMYPDQPQPKEPLCLKFKDKGQICFGGYVWPQRCDVTGGVSGGDSTVSLVDLFAILRHIIGKASLGEPEDINTPGTPLWAADANGDHLVNILDLMKCINKAIGLPDPKAVAPDVFTRDVVALPGRTVSVPVEVSSTEDLAGVMLRFSYDASALSVGQPQLAERAKGMLLDYGLVNGELVVLVSSLTGEVIEAGAGAVVRVPFEVAEGVASDLAIELAEPIVFTAAEQVFFGQGSVVLLKVDDLIPAEFSLAQNYPNPFNPVTSVAYSLPEAAQVKVSVYNTLGQVVAVLVDGNQEAGYYSVEWNAENMSSGVYFYRIQANGFTATKRMVLMK